MRYNLITILLFCCLVQMTTVANAHQKKGTNYYVDVIKGNDTNSGRSPAQAWRSLEEIANRTFSPGDSILLRSGQTWHGRMVLRSSGSDGMPIVIASYGAGNRPVLDGKGQVPEVVLLKDVDHIDIQDLEITNNATQTGIRKGIHILFTKNKGRHFYFRRLYIHHIMGDYSFDKGGKSTGGIGIMGAADTKLDDILIEDCEIAYINRVGIYTDLQNSSNAVRGSRPFTNLIVRKNRIHHCSGDGLIVRYACRPLIEYNVAYENHNASEELVKWGVALWCKASDEALFQYNEVYNTRGTKDGQGLDADLDSYRTIFQYNYSHDNEGGFLLLMGTSSETVVRYNISVNDGSMGEGLFDFNNLAPTDSIASGIFHNNTIILRKTITTPLIDQATESSIFYNNIFLHEGVTDSAWYNALKGRSPVFKNNSFTGYKKVPPGNIVTADLQLLAPFKYKSGIKNTDGFKMKRNSPLCKGVTMVRGITSYWPAYLKTDFGGAPLDPSGIGIGAYKCGSYNK